VKEGGLKVSRSPNEIFVKGYPPPSKILRDKIKKKNFIFEEIFDFFG
jgi:hypothetical protein